MEILNNRNYYDNEYVISIQLQENHMISLAKNTMCPVMVYRSVTTGSFYKLELTQLYPIILFHSVYEYVDIAKSPLTQKI